MAVQIILETVIMLLAVCGMVIHSGWTKGETRRDFFRYYTNLSNLLVAMFFLIRLVVRITGNYDGFFGRIVFKELWFFSVTMAIFLTFGIFHFVLVPALKKEQEAGSEFAWLNSFPNYCVHYIVPLLSLLDWFLFAERAQLSYSWALIWTVIPLAYVAFAFIRASDGVPIENTTSAYPYDFMDPSHHGWKRVIINCVLVFLVFCSAGFVLLFINKLF